MICIGCDCSEFDPCIDELGETCAWVFHPDGPLCSFCAEVAAGVRDADDIEEALDDQPLVQLASDAQCDAFLRGRRAGA